MSIPKLRAAMEKYVSQLQRWALAQQDRLRGIQAAPATVNIQPMKKINPIPPVKVPKPLMKEESVTDKKISEEATNVGAAEAMQTQPVADKFTMDTELQPAALKSTADSEKPTADKPEDTQSWAPEK